MPRKRLAFIIIIFFLSSCLISFSHTQLLHRSPASPPPPSPFPSSHLPGFVPPTQQGVFSTEQPSFIWELTTHLSTFSTTNNRAMQCAVHSSPHGAAIPVQPPVLTARRHCTLCAQSIAIAHGCGSQCPRLLPQGMLNSCTVRYKPTTYPCILL